MINKKTIMFFIFMFIVLYMISPPNNNNNNTDTVSNKNKLNKNNKKIICNNIDNIENALNDLIILVKESCNKNTSNMQSSSRKVTLSNKMSTELERELNAKNYLRQKIKESFIDVQTVPTEESNQQEPTQQINTQQYMQKQNTQQENMQLPEIKEVTAVDSSNMSGYSSYSDLLKDDNILNPM